MSPFYFNSMMLIKIEAIPGQSYRHHTKMQRNYKLSLLQHLGIVDKNQRSQMTDTKDNLASNRSNPKHEMNQKRRMKLNTLASISSTTLSYFLSMESEFFTFQKHLTSKQLFSLRRTIPETSSMSSTSLSAIQSAQPFSIESKIIFLQINLSTLIKSSPLCTPLTVIAVNATKLETLKLSPLRSKLASASQSIEIGPLPRISIKLSPLFIYIALASFKATILTSLDFLLSCRDLKKAEPLTTTKPSAVMLHIITGIFSLTLRSSTYCTLCIFTQQKVNLQAQLLKCKMMASVRLTLA